MRQRIFLSSILLFAITATLSHAQIKNINLDGTDWKGFSESAKVAYAAGFMDAAITFMYGQKSEPSASPGCTADKKGDFRNIAIGQMTDGMDSFYKDYRNQRVHLGLAMLYIRDTITGCNSEILNKELDSIRNSSVSDNN